jgi:hypothetical protein
LLFPYFRISPLLRQGCELKVLKTDQIQDESVTGINYGEITRTTKMKQAKTVDNVDSKIKVKASQSIEDTKTTDEGLSGGHVSESGENPEIPESSTKDSTAEIAEQSIDKLSEGSTEAPEKDFPEVLIMESSEQKGDMPSEEKEVKVEKEEEKEQERETIEESGTEQDQEPGEEPETEPGEEPGTEPGEEPGTEPVEEPGEEPEEPAELPLEVPVEFDHEIPVEVTIASASEKGPVQISEPINFKVDYSTLSREDLLDRLQELLGNKDVRDLRSDVDNIKINYYKKYKLEVELKRKQFVEKGGDIDEFTAPEDPLEPRIKDLLKQYRDLKAENNKTLEQEKLENVTKKYAVIDKIKDLINRKESINKTFQEFRELQKEWRSIGLVPQQNLKDLWETYNHHVETFYDYIKINKELRDLDLKKNLESKIVLCEKAEALLLEPSIIEAFNKLQKYHDQWREIGPVPPEIRTEIWERFREATSKINRKHQQHFEDLKKEQKNNLEQKRLLCEKAEDISNFEFKTIREWEQKSQELIELQKVWRTIGFAPKKDNNKIYKRFRTACDQFFGRKREFYTQNKEMYQNNLQLKTDLCIQAESLKDSTEWKKTTEDLIHLQEQWKLIGPVPRKHSDQVWKRFRAACDHFFNKKSEYYSSIDQTFESNLARKEGLIKEIEGFVMTADLTENFRQLNDFQRKWTEIGFVPLKDKDTIQEKYRLALNMHYDNLNIDDHKRNLLKFKNRVSSLVQKPKADLKLRQERDKFIIRMQQLKNDITLWENNIGFFAKSKNAQSMIDEVNNKITSAKEAIKLLEAKIEMIDGLDADQD